MGFLKLLRNSEGLLSIPLLLVAMATSIFCLGSIGLFRSWKKLVETQLRINLCIGKAALDLRDYLNQIESSNQRMEILRKAIAAASAFPNTRAPLDLALNFEYVFQEISRNRWKIKQFHWIAKRGCGDFKDIALPLPEPPWVRDPPDTWGPRPLRWTGKPKHLFELRVSNYPRQARAQVKNEKTAPTLFNKNKWHAQWPGDT